MDSELRRRIEEAKSSVNLVDLIGEDYSLREAGGSYWKAVDHDSLVVDEAKQCWFWNSQGTWGDAIGWLVKQRRLSFREALDYLLGSENPPQRPRARPAPPPVRNMALEAEDYHQRLLTSPSTLRQLQRERSLRLATIFYTMVGWHPGMKGWTIPHWRHGVADYCSGIKVRLARGKLRYASVMGSKFELYMPPPLLNLEEGMLHLAEGEFKVLSLMEVGTYAVGCPAGAFKKAWAQQLSKFGQHVFVWRDNDLGGLEFVAKVREAIPHAIVLAPPLQYKGVDDFVTSAGTITLQQLIEIGAQNV